MIRKVKTSESKFPEMGTAVFQFNGICEGTAEIVIATGEYIGSNGRDVSFSLE